MTTDETVITQTLLNNTLVFASPDAPPYHFVPFQITFLPNSKAEYIWEFGGHGKQDGEWSQDGSSFISTVANPFHGHPGTIRVDGTFDSRTGKGSGKVTYPGGEGIPFVCKAKNI
ncbi:MAG: hypothetical protein NPIRA05_01300 [Nitrospirales bacterium]|nr:MAG: hypothetical protein NPIRA05_01300 [Nitrospirales bacterium]